MYRAFHADRSDERLALFRGLVEHFGVTNALYPGSFVHVTPSFVIRRVVYVDSDRRAQAFFEDPRVLDLVDERREYEARPTVGFHRCDYREPLDQLDSSFDLLISQYAGFVSRACKRYLRVGASWSRTTATATRAWRDSTRIQGAKAGRAAPHPSPATPPARRVTFAVCRPP